jgi:hypothetical protein
MTAVKEAACGKLFSRHNLSGIGKALATLFTSFPRLALSAQ